MQDDMDNEEIVPLNDVQTIKNKPSESLENKITCFSKLSSLFSCEYKTENNENINLKIFEIIQHYISDFKDDTISDIIKPCKNIEYLFNSDIDAVSVIKLFYSDYTIFLTGKFLKNNKYLYNFKKRLLTYFDKYNIVYFNYSDKSKIVNLLNIINCFIKNSYYLSKNELIKSILNYCNTLDENYFDSSKKLKPLFFSENIFEPNILYKKIQFSNQEIFISFDSYIIKKMEYKLRTFCQIAEKLGAEKIVIDYTSNKHETNNSNLNLNIFSAGSLGIKRNTTSNNNDNIRIVFEYPNNHSDINLNKYYIIDSILSENEFLITKEEFESDLELKFLIDARCINFIQKYNTNFIINHINKVEQKIFLKAQSYGLNIGNLNLKNNFIKISVNIDFFQIHNNPDIIDGTNIHVLREGFSYLVNIIKKDDKYNKLLRFLQSHLNAIQKKWIYLNYDFDNIDKINKIYHNIINLNFKEDEICDIIKVFFENSLTWYTFKKFRDLILKGSDDKIEKLYFVTYQYHDIMNNKKHIMYDINKYIDEYLSNFINNFNKLKTNIKNINLDDEKENIFPVKSDLSLSNFGFISSEDFNDNSHNEIMQYSESEGVHEEMISSSNKTINKEVLNNDNEILNTFNDIINSIDIHKQKKEYTNLKKHSLATPIKHISIDIDQNDIELSSQSSLKKDFVNLPSPPSPNCQNTCLKMDLQYSRDLEKSKYGHSEADLLDKIKQNKSVQFDQNKNEYNVFELPDIDNDNFIIIYDFLIKNRSIIKNILYLLFQKSFKYIGGLSDNLSNIDKLIILIKNIIVYYFDNDIKNLQLILNNNLNNKFYFDLKKKIFEDLVEQLCTDLIKNDRLVLNANSPSVIQTNNEKETIHKRAQKIFLKTIIKYFNFENKIYNITRKLDIKTHNLEPELLISYLDGYIPLCKVYKNYNKCKLFYTWDDFLNICEYFNKIK